MKERRYKKEYRIVTDINPRTGRPKDIAVYTGDYWHFPEGSPTPNCFGLRGRSGRPVAPQGSRRLWEEPSRNQGKKLPELG